MVTELGKAPPLGVALGAGLLAAGVVLYVNARRTAAVPEISELPAGGR
jgi:hypothetical protein